MWSPQVTMPVMHNREEDKQISHLADAQLTRLLPSKSDAFKVLVKRFHHYHYQTLHHQCLAVI